VKQKLVDTAADAEEMRRENFQLRQQLEHMRKFGSEYDAGGAGGTAASAPGAGKGVIDMRSRSRTNSAHTTEEKQAQASSALAAMQTKSRRRKSIQAGEQGLRQRTASNSIVSSTSLTTSPPMAPADPSTANVAELKAKVM
jgi:hypothetical protein